jgi:nicotinamide-nucleotide amidase
MDDLKELLGRAPRLTLAVAESLTCGQVQARIGEISGASEFFLGGITAYTIDAKACLLGVDLAAATAVNGVSAEVAGQMAQGVRRLFGSDLALATTGYAEPDPARRVAQPFAWYAVAWGETVRSARIDCPGASRAQAQAAVAAAALEALLTWLRERPAP